MIKENSRLYLNKFQAQPCVLFDKVLPEMTETLGELITRRMKDLGIRNNSELARLIKRSDAYVGDLVNDRAKTKSGTYKPRPDTLANLSKHLQVSEIEILTAIGYAPKESAVPKKPTNVAEFFEVLDFLGLDVQFAGGFKTLETLGEDDLQELLDGIVANASAKVKRKMQGK